MSTNPVVRPTSITLACGDGNESLTDVTWTSWGDAAASATATYVVNSCEPSCAEGTPLAYPVRVVANKLTKHSGGQVYSNVTVTFGSHRPDGSPASEDFPMGG